MRIWVLAENWPPRIGGIERYLTGIVGHIKGHEITVIAPELPQLPLSKGEGLGEVNVIRHRFFYPMWPKWFPLYHFLAKKAAQEKPDLIICGKALVEGRIARKLHKLYGIPYVTCTYGMEIATWSARARIRRQLIRALQGADRVIYINTKTKQELLALGVAEEKLIRLYPGITMPSSVDTLSLFPKPYILCVARLVERKGIDDLITAHSKLSTPCQLVIAGDGPQREALQALAKQLGSNVTFTGSISDHELHALYANAYLFALTPKELPGDYEGFGMVYCEAASYGLPTVATRTGGVPEAVEHGTTGILATPNDTASITDALHTLLANPGLATQYGQAGKARVKQQFTWDTTLKDFNSYLGSI